MIALWISLKVGLTALIGMLLLSIPLGYLLARRQFPGKSVLESVLSLPLILPPVITGFALVWLLAPFGWLYRWEVAALAAGLVGLPLCLRSVRLGFASVDPKLEIAARNLGVSPWQVFWRVSFPLARSGIVAGALLGFGRALGEFGATILVAGNIPGRTQTMPLAIYSFTQRGEFTAVWPHLAVMTLLAFALIAVADRFQRQGSL